MTTFLAILTGGGLAALGGLLSGLVTNWLGDKRDQRTYEHERVMALDARRHQRLEQAYVELLAYLEHHAASARWVRPPTGPVRSPSPPTDEEVTRVGALTTAYGNDEVRALLTKWMERAAEFANADKTIRMVEESNNPSQQLEDEAARELEAIQSYRNALIDAQAAIYIRVRQELAGEV